MKKITNFKKSILFNCGYSKPISVYDIVKNFEKILKYKIEIKIKSRRPGDVEKIYSNNNMQKKQIPGWKQKYSLSHSIISALKWEKIKF
jgi:UDP-glucose 4-epimerase